jgi:hypothetical protein
MHYCAGIHPLMFYQITGCLARIIISHAKQHFDVHTQAMQPHSQIQSLATMLLPHSMRLQRLALNWQTLQLHKIGIHVTSQYEKSHLHILIPLAPCNKAKSVQNLFR